MDHEHTAPVATWIPLARGIPGLKELSIETVVKGPWSLNGKLRVEGSAALSMSQNSTVLNCSEVGTSLTFCVSSSVIGLNITRHTFSGIIVIQNGSNPDVEIDLYGIWHRLDDTLLVVSDLTPGPVSIVIKGRSQKSFGEQIVLRSVFLGSCDAAEVDHANQGTHALGFGGRINCVGFNARQDKNVGDLRSSPLQYFPWICDPVYHDIFAWHPQFNRSYEDRCRVYEDLQTRPAIIGGGGLLETPWFAPALDFIQYSSRKVVLWGIGHNSPDKNTWVPGWDHYSFSASNYARVGVRDFGTRFRWVPCASCLSPELKQSSSPTREIGFFMHAVVQDRIEEVRATYPEAPILDNFATWEETIQFIQSCETIITNSFHGAYWATLLKRKVVAIPTSSKFFSFKHPVVLRELTDWQSGLSETRVYEEALDECVNANLEFAGSVIDFLSS